MTSDAKIGLLLGLVFIFVIAFIINGLPNLKPQQATRADVPVVVGFDGQEVGITGRAKAEADRDWTTLGGQPQEPAPIIQTPVEPPSAVVAETFAAESQVAGGQDVRYETLLPGEQAASPRVESLLPRIDNPLGRIESILNRFAANQQGQGASTVDMSPMQPATVEPQRVIQTQQPTGQPRVDVRPAEQRNPAATSPAQATAANKPIVGRIYVVGEGESLSTVAKNVYGPEEGNRYVNINRIYEANKDILKSVNEVVVGQKLIIPPLPKPTVNPDKPSDILSKELFEKVESIAKRPTAQTPTAASTPTKAPTPAVGGDGRWYTIQEGDNLWKIASAQLGAGARYDEIAKLNTDLLKDGEKLKVGMKIRLPLK
jgi:nucleoid-associated protein YgaU